MGNEQAPQGRKRSYDTDSVGTAETNARSQPSHLRSDPTLSHEEWLRVVDLTKETAPGPVPIMAGAPSNNTREAVAKAKEISARPGVDYVLTATPYYNKPTQEGVYQHFKAIAEASAKPLLLYNIAGRTGTNIETSTLLRLAEVPNIAGVKEASGNIS